MQTFVCIHEVISTNFREATLFLQKRNKNGVTGTRTLVYRSGACSTSHYTITPFQPFSQKGMVCQKLCKRFETLCFQSSTLTSQQFSQKNCFAIKKSN